MLHPELTWNEFYQLENTHVPDTYPGIDVQFLILYLDSLIGVTFIFKTYCRVGYFFGEWRELGQRSS